MIAKVRRISCSDASDYKPCCYILAGDWAQSYSSRSGAAQGLRRVWTGRRCEAPSSFAVGDQFFCATHQPEETAR